MGKNEEEIIKPSVFVYTLQRARPCTGVQSLCRVEMRMSCEYTTCTTRYTKRKGKKKKKTTTKTKK